MIRTLAFPALFALTFTATAEELALNSLKSLEAEDAASNYGPYVGIFGGTTQSQGGERPIIGTNTYDLIESSGDLIAGIEVGHSWKNKRFPLEAHLEFEGSFLSSQVEGQIDSVSLLTASGSDIGYFVRDFNAAIFMLNGGLGLDLWRYRARIGPVLARLRPYVGAGFGGAQVWFRDPNSTGTGTTSGLTVDGLATQNAGGTPSATNTNPSTSAFSTDQFVFAWQSYFGIEYRWSKKLSIYSEWRQLTLEDIENVPEYESENIVAGIRLRY
ncbi:MAG: hypothetical protein AAF555_06355 [Verrucomicrobiota bacterium]